MRSRYTLLAASLVGLVGCSDSSTGSSGLSGTLSFSYSGDLSGSFSATGSLPLSGQNTVAWAVGGRDAAEEWVAAQASQPQSGGTYNYVIVIIPRITVGTSNIDANCSAATCAAVLFELGVNDGAGTSQQTCFLDAGTVAITSISGRRAQGTFSGTGTCISSVNANSNVNITGGTFDVALLTGVVP